MDSIKILMVTNHFHPSNGGLEHQAERLASQLITAGHVVRVITPQYDGLSLNDSLGKISIERFPIIESPHTRYGLYSKLYYAFSLSRCIFKNKDKAKILHVHQALFAAFISVIVGKLLNLKTIIKISGSGRYGNIRIMNEFFWGGSFMLKILKHANCYISLSDETTRELLDNHFDKDKIQLIPNGVNIPSLLSEESNLTLRKKFKIPHDCFVCLFAGRLSVEKNLKNLINTWSKIQKHHNNTCLMIAGDGPERGSLEALTSQLGLSDNILFLGNMPDISILFRISQCFVLPSISEGMSNSLLEAMSFGLPCIASNISGNRMLIRNFENGILFDLMSESSLAGCIINLIENPELAHKIGMNARITVLECYSIEFIASRYITLYQNLLNSKKQNEAS